MSNKPNTARAMAKFVEAAEQYVKATQDMTNGIAKQNQILGSMLSSMNNIVETTNRVQI